MSAALAVVRRIGTALLTIVLASLFVFLAVQLLPGDVAQQLLGQNATPEAVATLRASWDAGVASGEPLDGPATFEAIRRRLPTERR